MRLDSIFVLIWQIAHRWITQTLERRLFMSFLVVLGGVAGAVAATFVIVIAVWACTAKPVQYQVITKKAEILPATERERDRERSQTVQG